VTFHHKQNGGVRGKDAGCLVDGVGAQALSARPRREKTALLKAVGGLLFRACGAIV
jgi:hypothetical protein